MSQRESAPPAARDPRMDRAREPDRGATLLMVPRAPGEPVQVVDLGGDRARGWRWISAALATTAVLLAVVLVLTLPRASAYTRMMQENFELRARLQSVERKMGEVDRILLRLRLYDAQLESLGGANGGSGPHAGELPLDPIGRSGNRVLRNARGRSDGGEGTGSRPASAWAASVEGRADRLLRLFDTVEPDLTVLVEEMESLDALDRALPSFWPAAGFMTSHFGWRRNPLGFDWKHHAGLDIGGQVGDPIWAAAAGTVRHAGPAGTYGKLVTIDHGFGVTTHYAHCSRVLVRRGQRVRRGQQLALLGNTGRSTGPHLHFEVRLDNAAVDPLDYLPTRRGWVPPWRSADGD